MASSSRSSALGVVDQVVSSGTNFLTAFIASWVLLPADFGAFVVAYAVVTVTMAAARAFIGEPMLAHLPTLPAARRPAEARSAIGTAVCVGVGGGLLALALGLSGVPSLSALVWLAPWVPIAVTQDACRFVLLSRSLTGSALASDTGWAIGQGVVLVVAAVTGGLTIATLSLGWGIGALVGIVVAGSWRGGPGCDRGTPGPGHGRAAISRGGSP